MISACNARLIGIVVALGILLGGCGSLGVGEQETGPPELYRLTAPTEFGPAMRRVPWQLVVSEPVAAGGLEDSRIAVRHSEFQLEYYADGRWASETPQMFRNLVVTSFQNAGVLAGVGLRSVRVDPEYSLRTEILRLESVYPAPGVVPYAEVVVNVSLIREPEQTVVRTRRFVSRVNAASETLPDVIAALDEASDSVLRDLVRWTVSD